MSSSSDPVGILPPHHLLTPYAGREPQTSDFQSSVFSSLRRPQTSSSTSVFDFVFVFDSDSSSTCLRLVLRLVFDMSQTRLTTRPRHVSDSFYRLVFDSSSTRLYKETVLNRCFWCFPGVGTVLNVLLAGRRLGGLGEAEPPQERGLLPFRSKLRLLRRAAH